MADHQTKRRPKTKVPEVAMAFWIIKIVAASLGWTAGRLIGGNLGERNSAASPQIYLITAAAAAVGVVVLVYLQASARRFDRWMYWLTFATAAVCATSTAGLAQLSNASGYPAGALFLLPCLGAVLFAWQRTLGGIDVENVAEGNVHLFYWLAIIVAQALGFALGDAVAGAGFGYAGAAAVAALIVAAIAGAHFKTSTNKVLLFWAAVVFTCPLSAALADFLFRPLGHGGLALSPTGGAIVLLLAAMALVYILPPRSAGHSSQHRSKA